MLDLNIFVLILILPHPQIPALQSKTSPPVHPPPLQALPPPPGQGSQPPPVPVPNSQGVRSRRLSGQNAKQLKSYMKAKNSVGNRRGMNPKGIQNAETFGFKLPVDAAIVDATMFQSMYGAVSGYEGTIRAAKAAGLSNDEAHMLAAKAAGQMGILYGSTGFINPRIPAIGKLDDLLASNGLFNKAIKQLLKSYSTAIKQRLNSY